MANVELVKAIKNGNVVTSLGELAAGDTVTMKGDGSTVAGALALNNAANTSSTTLQSGAVTSNVTFTLPDAVGSAGQVLKVSSVPDASTNVLTWGADTEGIALTALSVTTSAANGSGTLSYDNTSGVFTFAPADLSSISSDLVNDATPQLGGNLDVNGRSIVSVTNGNISILPDGTGSILLDGDGTVGNGGVTVENGIVDVKNAGTVSKIRLYCESANAHFTELVSDAHANYTADVTLTLPTTSGTVALTSEIPTTLTDLSITDGTIGQVLSTDGNGSFSFTTISTATQLDALTDVDATSTVGQVLQSDGDGTYSFTTISTATQLDALTDVDATSSVGQVLQSDGDGTYSFVSPSASGAASITSGTIDNVAIGGTTSFDTTGTVKMAGAYPFSSCNFILGTGAASGLSNTSSCWNVVIGVNAANGSAYLQESVVIGEGALRTAASTSGNVAIGRNALKTSTSGEQTGIGLHALMDATTGCHNTAVGTFGMGNVTSGIQNTSIGFQAGGKYTTGSYNTSMGYCAGAGSADGASNVAIGLGAMANCCQPAPTGASFNTALGTNALQFYGGANSVRFNTAVGINSMGWSFVSCWYNTAVGANTMCDLTSGQYNTALGGRALPNVTSGGYNIGIGYASGGDALCCITTQSNIAIFGNNTTSCFIAKVALTVPSDCRDKTDISDSPLGLNFINSICPVSYKFDDRASYPDGVNPDGTLKENKCRLGFIAQNVISAEQEHNPNGPLLISNNEREDRFSITETSIIPALVKAVQELTQRINQLEMV